MHFDIVFDLERAGYKSWWFPSTGLIFIVIGALLVFAPGVMEALMSRPLKGRFVRIFSWFFFVFAILWTLVSFAASYSEYLSLRHALEAGRYSIVEGEVTNFNPMPHNGKGYESFVVSGKRFIFSDSELSAGFNQTTLHGSPIHAGAHVRIAYVGGTIVRLEVAK